MKQRNIKNQPKTSLQEFHINTISYFNNIVWDLQIQAYFTNDYRETFKLLPAIHGDIGLNEEVVEGVTLPALRGVNQNVQHQRRLQARKLI